MGGRGSKLRETRLIAQTRSAPGGGGAGASGRSLSAAPGLGGAPVQR